MEREAASGGRDHADPSNLVSMAPSFVPTHNDPLEYFPHKLSSEIRINSNLAETLEEPQLCPGHSTQQEKKERSFTRNTESFNLLNVYLQVSLKKKQTYFNNKLSLMGNFKVKKPNHCSI